MYRSFLVAILFGFSFLIFFAAPTAQNAEAHTPASDGSILAILHQDPSDTVIVGSSTKATLEFTDSTNRLDLTKCECRVAISTGSSTISNLSISKEQITFNYIPSNVGQASIIVFGSPIQGADFQSFKLVYTFKVNPVGTPVGADDEDHSQHTLTEHLTGGHLIHIVLFGMAILIVGYIVYRDRKLMKARH